MKREELSFILNLVPLLWLQFVSGVSKREEATEQMQEREVDLPSHAVPCVLVTLLLLLVFQNIPGVHKGMALSHSCEHSAQGMGLAQSRRSKGV